MSKVRHTIRCNKELDCELIKKASENNLTPSKLIIKALEDSLYGNAVPSSIMQQQAINFMDELQKIKDEHPEVNVSGIERVGAELCQISLQK